MEEKSKAVVVAFATLLGGLSVELFGTIRFAEILGDENDPFLPKTGSFSKGNVEKDFDENKIKNEINKIILGLSKVFGQSYTDTKLEYLYRELEKQYSSELVGKVMMPFIPKGFLENHRVQYLTRKQLEEEVLAKTKEFNKLNLELEEKVKQRTEELKKSIKEQHEGTKLLIRRDLELSRVNEKLQKLDEVKSNFISVIAHQLRTPLSGVKWTLSMLLNGDMGALNNDQKTFIMKSYESNSRMITLVNDMLVADGIQSGRVHYGFKHTNIIDLMDNVLFEMNPQALKKNISIKYKSKFENLPEAYIDPETMRALLQNLLENAIKYTMDGGKIEIDVKEEADYLTVSIADNGIGIPQDQQASVFARFFRARNAVKQETDGSGLGLYISKTIVEKNGGVIWFESNEEKGTTFYFTVPLHTTELQVNK